MPSPPSIAPSIATAPNSVSLVTVPGWNEIPWLWHGFGTRLGGVSTTYAPEGAPGELNLTFTPEDDRELVLRNRQLLAEAVTGNPATPILALRQVHSDIVVVAEGILGSPACEGDGQMTDQPGLLIGIQTADCIPVLVADRRRKAVAAFHAGWRGTVSRIVEKGIGRMRLQFGSQPEDLIAGIGPGIGPCCYAVGEEVHSAFKSQFAYAAELFHEVEGTDSGETSHPIPFLNRSAPGHPLPSPSLHLDLFEANRRQLLDAGLAPSAVQTVGGCTSCHPGLFFSHRASRGRTGRMMSVIGIGPE